MPGRPKQSAVRARLFELAIQELGRDALPIDYAEHWVAGGSTLVELANEVSKTVGFAVSRETVRLAIVQGLERSEASERLARARARGAHGLAERAKVRTENTPPTRELLDKTKQLNNLDLWLAERWNRNELGAQPQVQIGFSFGDVYLDTLRTRQVRQGIVNPLTIAEQDAEVIEVKQLTSGSESEQAPE